MHALLFHLSHAAFWHVRVHPRCSDRCSRPDVLFKFRLAHQAGGLLPRPAKNETPSGIVHRVRQILEGLQTGGVDRRHVSEAKN